MTRALAMLFLVAGCGSGESKPDLSAVGDDMATPVTGADFATSIRDFARPIPDGATPGEPGFPCDIATACHSGYCIDGYCCENLCDPASNFCKACNVPGAEGRCVFARSGTDPHGQCNADPPTSCAHDGLCDGNGGCRLYPAGSVCGMPSCSGDQVTYEPVCNGSGTCVAQTPIACAPYACADASGCASACSGASTGCHAPATCTNFSCGPRALGQPCIGPSDCASGSCAQGVCCDAACGAACMACNQPGSIGHCAACNASHMCNLSTGACL
jgi:hypothetical protein